MKPLLEFFPIVLFFAVYKLYDIFIATGVVIAATLVQVLIHWWLYRRVETMQWVTLALILVMGGATIYLQNEQFIKWKLTIIECLFGGAFLFSQFFGKKTFIERMMGANLELPSNVWKSLNLSWAFFFFAVGAINLYVMDHYSTDDWVSFKTFGVPGMMLGFVAIQVVLLYRFLPSDQEPKK